MEIFVHKASNFVIQKLVNVWDFAIIFEHGLASQRLFGIEIFVHKAGNFVIHEVVNGL